jgi:hypothetical protein
VNLLNSQREISNTERVDRRARRAKLRILKKNYFREVMVITLS